MGNSYITHYYTGDNCYEFGINSENGKLVGINFQTESFYKKESAASELRNARERAEEVARECAANFVNLEECGETTVSVVPLGDESGAAMDLYQYFFAGTELALKQGHMSPSASTQGVCLFRLALGIWILSIRWRRTA